MNSNLNLTKNAVNYIWRQLASRAGISAIKKSENGFEALNLPVYYKYPSNKSISSPGIYVIPSEPINKIDFFSLPPNSLEYFSSEEVVPANSSYIRNYKIPVLFWGKEDQSNKKKFIDFTSDQQLIFNADIILTCFFLLTRWEEFSNNSNQTPNRFLGKNSFLFHQGIHQIPIVDEYALIIRAWLQKIFPQWTPIKRSFNVQLTYDIDRFNQFENKKKFVFTLGETLLKKRQISSFFDTLKLGIQQSFKNPTSVGINKLIKISEERKKIDSQFFFLMGEDNDDDLDYNYQNDELQKTIKLIQEKEFEVGLHGTPNSCVDAKLLKLEKNRIENMVTQQVEYCRFHYLHFNVPKSWQLLEQAGFKYSFNMSFPDIVGFRCGTCHPYAVFDIENDREMDIIEIPLIVMDATLIHYLKLSPQEGKLLIIELAKRCKDVEGMFTLLWHNTSLRANTLSWGKIFPDIIADLESLI